MATNLSKNNDKAEKKVVKKLDPTFKWEATDRNGKKQKGEQRAPKPADVQASLKRIGYTNVKLKKMREKRGRKITEKDLSLFTRQLATMLRAGVPLLQSIDIVGKGHDNPNVGKLLAAVKLEIETGNSLSYAFSRHPQHFDTLYCNLIQAGEQAGILEAILDRLAVYKEKTLAVKAKIKSALFYPTAIMAVAFIVVAVIMIFVIPAFKKLFSSFGADLPVPTQIVMNMSDFFVDYWWIIFGSLGAAFYFIRKAFKQSKKLQEKFERALLKAPVFGDIVYKGALARWSRTLATMFAAGVPLVEALESVAGAAGNVVFFEATNEIRMKVSTGTTLTQAMMEADLFPNMMLQMTQIGEEAGAVDSMLNKVADAYEDEVDNAVAAMSSLMEPLIMAFLGIVIGGLVVAMYLPIFKMGSTAG